MSFGEHLEDLRGCLFRAVIGLMIGFCIGLAVGKQAVKIIERPLTNALNTFYTEQTIRRIEEEQRNPDSYFNHSETKYNVAELQKQFEQGMTVETRLIDVDDLKRTLGLESANVTPPTEGASPNNQRKLVPLLFWQEKKDDERTKPKSMSATEPFMIWMKASFVVGALISSPWVFYQLWAFVAAGLYRHERKYVYTFLPFSLGLFFLGAATAYLFVFEPVLQFLFGFNEWLGIQPDPRINEWIGFVLFLPLGFGISFQLPLVMLFVERIGVITAKDYIDKWRIAVLAIFVISAVLTPADPYSIFFMAVPLTFLYFGGILLAMYLPKSERPATA